MNSNCIGGVLHLRLLLFSTSHRILAAHPKISTSRSLSTATMSSQSQPPSPPLAEKVKREMELFGDVRVDNYYWLRGDSRKNPKVISYLQQENAYTEAMMSGMYICISISLTFCLFLGNVKKQLCYCFDLELY